MEPASKSGCSSTLRSSPGQRTMLRKARLTPIAPAHPASGLSAAAAACSPFCCSFTRKGHLLKNCEPVLASSEISSSSMLTFLGMGGTVSLSARVRVRVACATMKAACKGGGATARANGGPSDCWGHYIRLTRVCVFCGWTGLWVGRLTSSVDW